MLLEMISSVFWLLTALVKVLINNFFFQDNPSFPGGGAKDCEKGVEDPEGKGKTSLKELEKKSD